MLEIKMVQHLFSKLRSIPPDQSAISLISEEILLSDEYMFIRGASRR